MDDECGQGEEYGTRGTFNGIKTPVIKCKMHSLFCLFVEPFQ